MVKFVTITSQGQITIPAIFRKQLGLNKTQKALVSVDNNRLVIQPEVDIMSLAGSLHKYAFKGKTINEIIKFEEDAVAEAVADKYRKFVKHK